MFFLGNLNSVHIGTWFTLYKKANIPFKKLYSVHQVNHSEYDTKQIFIFSKIISYIVLGIYLLIRLPAKAKLHAHGASGYGLAALISRKTYIVTVYGSEVFAKHSYFYDAMMKRIFLKASMITVTSLQAKQTIIEKFQIPANKICQFHTGINTQQLSEHENSSAFWHSTSTFKCLSIRNTASHYQTEAVIAAYLDAINSHIHKEQCQLIIVLGNGDENYFNALKHKYTNPSITFIDKLLTLAEMHELMSDSSVCINFPLTDQLSATLLEAIFYGKYLISSDVPSYKELFRQCEAHNIMLDIVPIEKLKSAIQNSITQSSQIHHRGRELIEQRYSQAHAASIFKQHFNITIPSSNR